MYNKKNEISGFNDDLNSKNLINWNISEISMKYLTPDTISNWTRDLTFLVLHNVVSADEFIVLIGSSLV